MMTLDLYCTAGLFTCDLFRYLLESDVAVQVFAMLDEVRMRVQQWRAGALAAAGTA